MKTRTAKLKPAGVRSRASDSSQSVRVVVIDDHEVVRCGLRRVAEGASHHIVGEACTLEDGLQLCRTQKPDVVLLDIRVDRIDAASPDAAGGSFELIGQIFSQLIVAFLLWKRWVKAAEKENSEINSPSAT